MHAPALLQEIRRRDGDLRVIIAAGYTDGEPLSRALATDPIPVLPKTVKKAPLLHAGRLAWRE